MMSTTKMSFTLLALLLASFAPLDILAMPRHTRDTSGSDEYRPRWEVPTTTTTTTTTTMAPDTDDATSKSIGLNTDETPITTMNPDTDGMASTAPGSGEMTTVEVADVDMTLKHSSTSQPTNDGDGDVDSTTSTTEMEPKTEFKPALRVNIPLNLNPGYTTEQPSRLPHHHIVNFGSHGHKGEKNNATAIVVPNGRASVGDGVDYDHGKAIGTARVGKFGDGEHTGHEEVEGNHSDEHHGLYDSDGVHWSVIVAIVGGLAVTGLLVSGTFHLVVYIRKKLWERNDRAREMASSETSSTSSSASSSASKSFYNGAFVSEGSDEQPKPNPKKRPEIPFDKTKDFANTRGVGSTDQLFKFTKAHKFGGSLGRTYF